MKLSPEKIEILKKEYPDCVDPKELARRLGITPKFIYNNAKKYGLRRRCNLNAHVIALHDLVEKITPNKQSESLTTIRDLTNYTMKDFSQDLNIMYQEGFLSSIQYNRYTSTI